MTTEQNLVAWRGKHCFVIMNRYPYNSGHVMIVPNRQTGDVQDLTKAEMTEIMQAAQNVMKALDGIMHPQGYNFGANFGRTARRRDRRSRPFSHRPAMERGHELHACALRHEGDFRGDECDLGQTPQIVIILRRFPVKRRFFRSV